MRASGWTAVLFASGAFLMALLIGPAGVDPLSLLRALWRPDLPGAETARTILLDLRLPRAILAALVGAGLGVSGALLQAYFQNPMAGPYVTGISSGAGLAVAVAVVVAGERAASSTALSLAALAGGISIVAIASSLAERIRARKAETLLLLGLALAAVCSAITSVLLLMMPRGPEGVLFWLMGSLAGASWTAVARVAAALVIGLGLALWHARALDALLWGEDVSRSVGVDLRRARTIVLVAATVPVAASVAACGVIGFLGLMVPHIARGIVGAAHERMLPACAVLGAGLLLAADVVARIVLAPAEMPVGAITSAIGAPFLIWICMRRRNPWDSSASTQRRSSPKDGSSSRKGSTTRHD